MTPPPPFSNVTPNSNGFLSTSANAEELTSVPINRGGQDVTLSSFLDDTVLGSISPEFLNYALALLVYAVRYPSVFWNTNKWFGTLFSLQLVGNGVQSLLSFAGVSVLYKVQVAGVHDALPILKKSTTLGTPFLLDAYFTLGLFLLSSVLVLSTSLVLYLYGYGRFNAFLNAERERKVIVFRENKSSGWGYFTHCAALSVLIALAVCHAPLLHDYTVVYRGSLDGSVLACVVTAILHLFLWVLIWLVLTVKQKWIFQLRVTIGRAAVRSARSVKLVTDVDLVSCGKQGDDVTAPLLVVGGGRTYTISDMSPKRAIINVIQKAAMERKARLCAQGSQTTTDDDTEIYWLRPKPQSPKCSPSDSDRLNWFNRKLGSSQKQKVTFNETVVGGSVNDGKGKIINPMETSQGIVCEDDGDYATLRMGPTGKFRSNKMSEENKLLEHALRDDNVTFARSSDLQPDYEDPSPLLTPEPNDLLLPPPPPPPNASHSACVVVHNNMPSDKTITATPKCLRRADSGMPHEELTPRSGSVSSGSQSGSGGSPPGVQNSESSSGVHSNASSRRATSVDDLTVHQEPRQTTWKSCSLQRNVLPPGSQPIYNFSQNHEQHPPVVGTVPSVILENPGEDTVVIRRKSQRPLTADLTGPPEIKEDPFGRSTNMRMTSFTDESSGSATLPHFPTQPPPTSVIYPCNTMPLPCPPAPPVVMPVKPISCNLYPRPHTTLPIHHNGVRLFPSPYAKKHQYPGGVTRFPVYSRDPATYSTASSVESVPHS
ncbi:hypothetical protein RUM43_007520 [Polyplax serrata]|uniref:Protein tincar n=1 Tax=Polyplax serrata TaxID=468196 RepID=A0AAN8P216_POLSC